MSYLVIGLLTALGIALGVAGVIFGGADDSPGLQLIGVVIVIGTVVLSVRALRRRRRVS
jgi:drug/metabolite transporter (DMT)-like permease